MAMMALAFNLLMALQFFGQFAGVAAPWPPMQWAISLFWETGIILLGYFSMATLINKTIVSVTAEAIHVRIAGLPWPGEKKVFRQEVAQLFVDRSGTDSGTMFPYHLMANLASQKHIKLVSGLPFFEQARFLEQEIERFLGILDKPSEGEIIHHFLDQPPQEPPLSSEG